MLDIEYFIHKVASAFLRGLSKQDIYHILSCDGLSEEEIHLVMCAGEILSFDWMNDNESPTKPDHKSPIPPKLN